MHRISLFLFWIQHIYVRPYRIYFNPKICTDGVRLRYVETIFDVMYSEFNKIIKSNISVQTLDKICSNIKKK